MSREIKASEIQDYSIATLGNLVKIVKEHPQEQYLLFYGFCLVICSNGIEEKKSKNVTKKLNLARKTQYKSKMLKFENAGIWHMKIDI